MSENNEQEKWNDLPIETRDALKQIAKNHLAWKHLIERSKWLGSTIQVFLGLGAAWILFREFLAEWLKGLSGS